MVNIKSVVSEILEDALKDVEISDNYPSDFNKKTQLTFTEEQNKAQDISGTKVLTSYIRYRIDIWDKESTSDTACTVDKELNEKLGLIRTDCTDSNEPERKHKIMRFEGVIDEDYYSSGRMYTPK